MIFNAATPGPSGPFFVQKKNANLIVKMELAEN
jgi:hypothetical protein